MRFFLVDRIIDLKENDRIDGIKSWTFTDEIFQDHFPGNPVVPGVLLLESMAQLLGILINRSYPGCFPEKSEEVFAVLSLVHKASFHKFVIPGDQTRIIGDLGTIDTLRASGKARIEVDGELRARSELSFVLIPRSQLMDDAVIEQQNRYFKMLTQGIPADSESN